MRNTQVRELHSDMMLGRTGPRIKLIKTRSLLSALLVEVGREMDSGLGRVCSSAFHIQTLESQRLMLHSLQGLECAQQHLETVTL